MAIITTFNDLHAHTLATTKAARNAIAGETAYAKSIRKAYMVSSKENDPAIIEALVRGIRGNENFKMEIEVPRYSVYLKVGKPDRLYFKSSDKPEPEFERFATDDEIAKKFTRDAGFIGWVGSTYGLDVPDVPEMEDDAVDLTE